MTANPSGRLRLEYLDASQLNANPENWRTHPPEQMAAIGASLDELGWAGALLYNERTRHLLNGHARLKWAEERGGAAVPVLIGSWDEQTERRILAVLDPIGEMAG